jgi:hypothetical protein
VTAAERAGGAAWKHSPTISWWIGRASGEIRPEIRPDLVRALVGFAYPD